MGDDVRGRGGSKKRKIHVKLRKKEDEDEGGEHECRGQMRDDDGTEVAETQTVLKWRKEEL